MLEESSYYKKNSMNLNLCQTNNIIQEDTGLRDRKSKKKNANSINFNNEKDNQALSIKAFAMFGQKLFNVNKEFMIILIYILISFLAMSFEFFYGILYAQIDIISDSFFNLFKTLAFVITALSILVSKYFNSVNKIIIIEHFDS